MTLSTTSHKTFFILLAATVSLVAAPVLAQATGYTISGYVFEDANGNGIKDAGEAGMPGEIITLQTEPEGVFVRNDGTNELGGYGMGYFAPRLYRISHIVPPGYVRTTDDNTPINVQANASYSFGVQKVPVQQAVVTAPVCGTPTIYDAPAPSGGDDGPALQALINSAILDVKNGTVPAAEVQLKAGASYYLASRPGRYDSLDIRTPETFVASSPTVPCFTLAGQTATLLIDQISSGLYVGKCKDCVVKDLTIKGKEEGATQGKVTAVHVPTSATDLGWVDVKISPDFPLFTIPQNYDNPTKILKPSLVAIFHAFDTTAYRLRLAYEKSTTPHVKIDYAAVTDATQRVMRVWFNPADDGAAWTKATLAGVVANKTVIEIPKYFDASAKFGPIESLWTNTLSKTRNKEFSKEYYLGSRSAAIHLEENNNLTLKNVTVTNYEPGMGISLMSNMGPVTIDGFHLAPSDIGHLLSGNSDGIHGNNNRGTITIRNSLIENNNDDGVNLSATPYYASAISADRKTVTLTSYLRPVPILPGDRFTAFNSATGATLSSFTASNVVTLAPLTYQVTAISPLPASIVLNTGATPTAFVDLDMVTGKALIENNVFLNGIRYGVILKSGGTIQNNVFINLGAAAIMHTLAINRDLNPPRGEWGDLEPLIIRGNTVIGVNDGLLNEGNGIPTGASLTFKGITVSNNKVYMPRDLVVERRALGTMLDPVTASGNTIYMLDTDTRTSAQLVKDPQWKTPLTLARLPAAQLASSIAAASPVPQVTLQFVSQFFGLPVLPLPAPSVFVTGFSSTQGKGGWHYQYKLNGAYTDLTWDTTNNRWALPNKQYPLISSGRLHPANNADAGLKWVAPQAGTIKIVAPVKDANTTCGDGVVVSILKNSTSLWSANIANGDTAGKTPALTTSVAAGDSIYFMVNKGATDNACDGTDWNPTITYTAAP